LISGEAESVFEQCYVRPLFRDRLTKVCLCKAISRASIKKAIKNGAVSIEEVKQATGAGTGSCSGKRCSYKIQALIDQETK